MNRPPDQVETMECDLFNPKGTKPGGLTCPNGTERWDVTKLDRRVQAGMGFFILRLLNGVTPAASPLPYPPPVPGRLIRYTVYRYDPYRIGYIDPCHIDKSFIDSKCPYLCPFIIVS